MLKWHAMLRLHRDLSVIGIFLERACLGKA